MQTDLELFEEFLRKNRALTKFKEALWEHELFQREISPKFLNPKHNRKHVLKKDVWEDFKQSACSPKYFISAYMSWVSNRRFWSNLDEEWKMFYSLMKL